MSKIIIKPNKSKDIEYLDKLNIDGIIFPLEGYSIESSCFFSLKEILDIKTNKEKIVLINKIMHNKDIDTLKDILMNLNNSDISKIMFYDIGVYNLCKKLNINKELVIYQDHLNRSINSNNFYNKLGINYSYISSDITMEEVKEIKNNTNMKIFYLVYGRIPLFCSRRYLLTNYLDYINNSKKDSDYYIKNNDNLLYIDEESNGTVIYSDIVNLINKIKEIDFIDYLVMDFNNIDNYDVIDNFINKTTDGKEYYLGFYNTKTIFKVK